MAAPTRLSGVEAPDVSPIASVPDDGSHPVVAISIFEATGRWRISCAETRQSGLAMWKVDREAAQMRARLHVLLLLYPPMTIIKSIGRSWSRATTASWRSCVALQIVSNA